MRVNVLAINLLATYQNIFKQINFLKSKEKLLNEQKNSLSIECNKKKEERLTEYEKEVSAIEDKIRDLEVYEYGARCHGAVLSGYNPFPEKTQNIVFQQMYTMLSYSQEGKIVANNLLKKCANQKRYYEEQLYRLKVEYNNSLISIEQNAFRNSDSVNILNELNLIQKKYDEFAEGKTAHSLIQEIKSRATTFFIKSGKIYNADICKQTHPVFCFGFVCAPYPLPDIFSSKLQRVFGNFYNQADKSLLLPLCILSEKPNNDSLYSAINISISYNDTTRDISHEITHGILFNILRNYTPLHHRVTYVDFDTFNPEHLGYMNRFVGEDSLINYPISIEGVNKALQLLISEANSEPENNRQRRYLFVKGIGASGNGEILTKVKRICNNCKKNNICTIFVDYNDNQQPQNHRSDIKISFNIFSNDNGQFATSYLGFQTRFCFLVSPKGLNPSSESVLISAFVPPKTDNRYENFFNLCDTIPYVEQPRKRNKLAVTYGLEEKKGKLSRIIFEKMDFATFLMGGSGSGKTTLIHTIITDIIRNYHPDEVELWLADFKYSGFAPYVIKDIPPHIKYILMDKSDEMIFDFIDLMHAELERRERLTGTINIEDRLDTSVKVYFPTIFVIMDEFSAVSQAFERNYSYRDKLDDLLSKGRSKGFRFIFASQAYTTSASALSSFAKKQISSRIAMKNSEIDEIKDTLNIPSSQRSSDISILIDTLTDHYTLYKKQQADGSIEIIKSLVLYFDSTDWNSRYNLYKRIRNSMCPIEEKDYSGESGQYVDKHPVIVSSDTLVAFNPQMFMSSVRACREDDELAVSDDDMVVSFGVPRNLSMNSFAIISKSARENIFLLYCKEEVICCMSIVLSSARSFRNQNGTVQVWGHTKSPVFRKYKETHLSKLNISEGILGIRKAIDAIYDEIKHKRKSNQLIILLGIESIYNDLVDGAVESSLLTNSRDVKSLYAKTPEEIEEAIKCDNDEQKLVELMNEFYEKGEAEGKTEEEMDAEFELIMQKYYDETSGEPTFPVAFTENADNIVNEPNEVIDYAERFKWLLEVGSRYGYHFMLVINDYNNMHDMKVGIGNFNHRLSFKTGTSAISDSIFDNSRACKLSRHVCLYSARGSSSQSFLITPFLHKGVTWDNWTIDENGKAINPSEKYKKT